MFYCGCITSTANAQLKQKNRKLSASAQLKKENKKMKGLILTGCKTLYTICVHF